MLDLFVAFALLALSVRAFYMLREHESSYKNDTHTIAAMFMALLAIATPLVLGTMFDASGLASFLTATVLAIAHLYAARLNSNVKPAPFARYPLIN